MLPGSFDEYGVLVQDYEASFDELRRSLLVIGPERPRPMWDTSWRRTLVDNLEILVRQLWKAGVTTIYIDGSFVQEKDHPGDIDGCFECGFMEWNSGALERRLNEAAPKKVWDWQNKRLVLGEPKLLMWASYRVELYPYCPEFPMGIETDDGFMPFPDAFRRLKSGSRSKGIIKLRQEHL